MSDDAEPRIVRPATELEAVAAFNAYALALGRATYAWNYLLEQLGLIFVYAVAADRNILEGVWYTPDNDRTKVQMLRATVTHSHADRWLPTLPSAKVDLDWLCVEAEKIIDDRNNAVHSPVILQSTPGKHEVVAKFMIPYRRARALTGKDLIAEFTWLESWSYDLSQFAEACRKAIISSGRAPWPERPQKPSRK